MRKKVSGFLCEKREKFFALYWKTRRNYYIIMLYSNFECVKKIFSQTHSNIEDIIWEDKTMAVVKELIRIEDNDTISFGNYELASKSKLSDFEYQGDMYKVKTFREITKLERNGMFVYESVPGTTVLDLKLEGNEMTFKVEGPEDAQITVELEADMVYEIFLDGVGIGSMKTNLGGKLSFSAELEHAKSVDVRIKKIG